MKVIKYFLLSLSALFIPFLCTVNSYATARGTENAASIVAALTPAEKRFRAQNNIIFTNDPQCDPTVAVARTGSLNGTGNVEKIINYFAGNNSKGVAISPEGIAGILGNIREESGFNPFRNQGQFDSLTGSMSDGNGYGIVQFTPRTKVLPSLQTDSRTASYFNEYYDQKYGGGRFQSGQEGVPEGVPDEVDTAWLEVELDYAVDSEFNTTKVGDYRNTYGGMGLDYINSSSTILEALNEAKSASDAARIFVWIYERPGTLPGTATARAQTAEEYLPIVKSVIGSSASTYSTAASATSTAKATGSVNGSNITIIGDSYSVGATDLYKKVISDEVDIHAEVGKQFYSDSAGQGGPGGYTILQDLINSKKLRDILVYALGTNSANTTESQVKDVVKAATDYNPNIKIIFVTNHIGGVATYIKDPTYANNNATFRKVANDNTNVSIADWAGAVDGNESTYFDLKDENTIVHPNQTGYEKFVDLIYAAIAGTGSGSNPSSSSIVCGGGVFSSNTNSSTTNGEPVFYIQWEEPWADKEYGNCGAGGTYHYAGCGPTSLASIIATMTGDKSVTPDVIGEKAVKAGYRVCGGGSYNTIANLAKDYGLYVKEVSYSYSTAREKEISDLLHEGKMIQISVDANSKYTGGAHFLGLRGITDDGKWLIFDSNNKDYSQTPQDPSEILPYIKNNVYYIISKTPFS